MDEYDEGDLIPGEWWCVEHEGKVVGYVVSNGSGGLGPIRELDLSGKVVR